MRRLQEEPDKKVFVTTTKNEPIARQMCQHLGITDYLDGVYGSTPTTFHKADVLERAITESNAVKATSIIIGDTKFNMIGGRTVGIKILAVTWGFGDRESLVAEKPDYIAQIPEKVLDIVKNYS